MVVCIDENENRPCFGVIKFIFIENNTIFFICEKLITVFDNHVHANKIIKFLNEHALVRYEDLCDSYPTGLIKQKDMFYILPL